MSASVTGLQRISLATSFNLEGLIGIDQWRAIASERVATDRQTARSTLRSLLALALPVSFPLSVSLLLPPAFSDGGACSVIIGGSETDAEGRIRFQKRFFNDGVKVAEGMAGGASDDVGGESDELFDDEGKDDKNKNLARM